jgi:hypothetical protein
MKLFLSNWAIALFPVQNDEYIIQNRSRYFPDLDVLKLINDCFKIANERNSSAAIRQLRQKLN